MKGGELTTVDFAGRDFTLCGDTFSPRASSIPLVEMARRGARLGLSPVLADLCCGSGALGITLVTDELGFESMLGLDISSDAVRSCAMNMRRYGVKGSALEWSAGAPLPVDREVFAICNPPFLSDGEVAADDPQRSSVFAAEDGTAIAAQCFRSAAGVASIVVLKSSLRHIDVLRERYADAFRPVEVHSRLVDSSSVAYSLWMSVRREVAP